MNYKSIAGIKPWGYFPKRAVEETDVYSDVLVERSPWHFGDANLETFFTGEQVRDILIAYETQRDDDFMKCAYDLGGMTPEIAIDDFLNLNGGSNESR